MTGPTPNDNLRCADDEAVEWLILLREEPDDPNVRARFDAWLAASPLNACAWAQMSYAYDRAGNARRTSSPRRRWPHRVSRRTLVAVTAAACLAVAAAPSVMLRLKADILTGTAELRDVSLTDGSTAQLAPGSAIAVSVTADRRHVRLLKGEAWLDVRHDPSRPFQVDAEGVTITVLGTAFDVKLDAEGVTTEVARGRVRVDSAGGTVSAQLEPGRSLRVAFDGTQERTTRPVEQVAAWRRRRIIVHDRPAGEVVDALRPWFSGTIIVRGERIARERVTGVYDATDPVEALRGLTQALGGRVTRITPWVIVLTER